MDYEKEATTFCTKLEQNWEKFNKWTKEELPQLKQDILYSDNKSLHQAYAQREHVEKVKELQKELCRVNKEAEERTSRQRQLDEELAAVTDDIVREKELLTAQEKAVSEKLGELEKAAGMFRERLGLRFKKTSGSRLQVIFTCVDDKDPEAPFFFYVQINEGKYIVSGCEPQVANIDALTEKLNATNNFRSFVIAVRKAFKSSIKN